MKLGASAFANAPQSIGIVESLWYVSSIAAVCPHARMNSEGRTIALTVVMPTTTWSGTFEPCARRVLELISESAVPCEFIVARDGPPADCPQWMNHSRVSVVTTGVRSGPAVARNLAVQSARGRNLLFVDSDVILATGTLERAHASLEADPGLSGIFGAYDDSPPDPGVVSRFKNLLHHHTHSTHPGPVGTFWAGCGAIRRDLFDALGGFKSSYGCPSVEDIELGMRATATGHRIEIDPALRCTHLKRWTLKSMVVTDIVHRAVPWARLLLSAGAIPSTLNFDWRGRVSGLCATAATASAAAAPLLPHALIAAAALAGTAIALNASFFRLCARKGGVAFACACIPLHLLYLVYSTVTFAAVAFAKHPLIGLLVAYLAAATVVSFALGTGGTWGGTDGDLQSRAAEYASFRDGTYPNPAVETPPPGRPPLYSVYLPYAFPMFAALFEPAGLAQARIMVPLLSAAALVAIGVYGSRVLSAFGIAWSAVGALAAAGITVNRSTLAQGQFAIICMGFIALQVMLLQRGRPMLAGVCWAIAMLKPHVGIAFAALFILNRQWRGLACGVAILVALAASGLWWTDVSPTGLAAQWLSPRAMRFTSEPTGFGPGRIAEWTGWSHRNVQYAMFGGVAAASAAAAIALRRVRIGDLLIPAAICATAGRLCFYHRPYDQVMLFPLLLGCLHVALRVRTFAGIAVASGVALTLWVPLRAQLLLPYAEDIQAVMWALAAAYLLAQLVGSLRTTQDQPCIR